MPNRDDLEFEKFDDSGYVKISIKEAIRLNIFPVDTGGNPLFSFENAGRLKGSFIIVDTAGNPKLVYDPSGNLKVASFLMDSNGTAVGLQFADGKPRVSSMPYENDIAEGNMAGHTVWSKIGFTAGVGLTERDIAPWMTGPYIFPTGNLTMTISSDSSQDTKTTGTGAWTVNVHYLDDTFAEKIVTIDMNGTGVVTVGTDVYRINNARIATAGSGNAAAGNISIKSGATTYGYISAGRTRQRQCVWTVPLGKKLHITQIAFSSSNQKTTVPGGVRFTTKANYDNLSKTILQRGLFMPYNEVTLFNNSYERYLKPSTVLPATVDLKVSAVSLVADTADITCSLNGWLETV